MTKKKKKDLTAKEKEMLNLKYEIAREIGIKKKIKKKGWGGLTSRETGKIGGYMFQRLKEKEKD